MSRESLSAQLTIQPEDAGRLKLVLAGDWRARRGLPGAGRIEQALLEAGSFKEMSFDTGQVTQWNTGLLVFVVQCRELCQKHQIQFHGDALPEGLRKLMDLALAVPEKTDARRNGTRAPWLERLGDATLRGGAGAREVLDFLGENLIALARLLTGRAHYRWSDTLVVMQEAGPEALGIVLLINFLVGLILAFVGAVQLVQFGATIYVADLVAIATVREMGCIMTGIIVCGRTGAAFAAQLGTMKVNEEIDAFKTFGISAVEFLVLPRMVALLVMMPLLCVFADLIGIMGGFFVAVTMLDLTPAEYFNRTVAAISLPNFVLGITKGAFFGFLVALTGCLRGMQCGTNAAAVGQAATSAVVAGITCIIAADGVFAVLCNALNL